MWSYFLSSMSPSYLNCSTFNVDFVFLSNFYLSNLLKPTLKEGGEGGPTLSQVNTILASSLQFCRPLMFRNRAKQYTNFEREKIPPESIN